MFLQWFFLFQFIFLPTSSSRNSEADTRLESLIASFPAFYVSDRCLLIKNLDIVISSVSLSNKVG
jgi:hypothetical protein